MPNSHLARQRRQVGHTNRWPPTSLLVRDLLGPAQVERPVTTDPTTQRTIKTADSALCKRDRTSWREPPLPWIFQSPQSGVPNSSRHCESELWSSQSAIPEECFYLRSQSVVCSNKPDVVLECLGSIWELHWPYFTQSATLNELYQNCKRLRSMEPQENGGSDKNSRNDFHCRAGSCLGDRMSLGIRKTKYPGPMPLQLPVKDPSITKDCLSFALQTLYGPVESPVRWGEGVLAVASLLGLPQLYQRCLTEMVGSVSALTVCGFHRVSCKYKETSLQKACERWLELFLVPELSCHINLRDLTFDLLLKTLRCPRVFSTCEYHLLRSVLHWVYLQFTPQGQTAPPHDAVILFFRSWPAKAGAFLEHPIGQRYAALFQALRLHGITERHHLEELQLMKIFPPSWFVHIFTNHYYTFLSGGNMTVPDSSTQAIRFGLIIERPTETQCCARTIGLYGFHFLFKAAKTDGTNTYGFSLERLRHWDPAVRGGPWRTQPFSMVSERPVRYQITVQACRHQWWLEFSSGPITQTFGLSKRCCRSQIFKVNELYSHSLPILATCAIAFPSS